MQKRRWVMKLDLYKCIDCHIMWVNVCQMYIDYVEVDDDYDADSDIWYTIINVRLKMFFFLVCKISK